MRSSRARACARPAPRRGSTGSLLDYEGHGIPQWRKGVPFMHAFVNKNGPETPLRFVAFFNNPQFSLIEVGSVPQPQAGGR